MANFYVTHHKFPSNPHFFTINLHKVAGLGGEKNPNFKPSFPSAERYWKVFIYTTGSDTEGELLQPIVADLTGGEETVNEFVENAVAVLCGRIDWSQQGQYIPEIDNSAPVVTEQYPSQGQSNVPISSPIVLRIQDLVPGSGVDISTVVMKVDGFTVNPTVTGNKYDSTFIFSPRPVYDS